LASNSSTPLATVSVNAFLPNCASSVRAMNMPVIAP
jgi:hypothetical protein